MSYVNLLEGNLSPKEVQTVKNHAEWISLITDDIKEVLGKDRAYIDISDLDFKTNQGYINYFLNLKKSLNSGYCVCIPLSAWNSSVRGKVYDINNINPISAIYNQMKRNASFFRNELAGIRFIFLSENGFFIVTADKVTASYHKEFANIIDSIKKDNIRYLIGDNTVPKKIKKDKLEKDENQDPIKPASNEEEEKRLSDASKDEIVNAISNAAKDSKTEEEAIDKLDNETRFIQNVVVGVSQMENKKKGPTINARRAEAMMRNNLASQSGELKGKKISDLLKEDDKVEELPSTDFQIDSINDEWKDMKYINFNSTYNIDEDIVKMLYAFTEVTYPISIKEISVQDTSTKMDYIDTYTVVTEDFRGERATWKIDVPQLINGRFLKLRGNEKVISGQLMLLPCTKTDPTTVQIVSNYNKAFIRLVGSKGKSTPYTDTIVKLVNRMEKRNYRNFKVLYGDYSTICAKYNDLPIDYVDLASIYSSIEITGNNHIVIDFDQDKLRAKFGASDGRIPIGYFDDENPILYNRNSSEDTCSYIILSLLSASDKTVAEETDNIPDSNKTMYSEVSILKAYIPVIVVLGYLHGLDSTLKSCGISYRIANNKKDLSPFENYIKIGKEYLIFSSTYANNFLINGLKKVPDIDDISIADLENRSTWINILGDIKTKLLSDGLDNFDDLFVDPITKEVCDECGFPTTFSGLLIQANALLADNNFNKHTDISVNRYRSAELIPGYLYNVLSKEYATFANTARAGKLTKQIKLTVKQTALIDAIMADPTESDLSTLSALLEIEAANATGFKGLSGLNSDRAYDLEKRTYDKSMLNKLSLSTGFSANVGVTRWNTIDMDIIGKRGYIKPDSTDDISPTKTFSMTEALTPFGTTRDDPFRSAMTFIQTSKHSMRTNASAPLLVTNGADEALPLMVSDKFAVKAKDKGEVTEIVEGKYMIVTYSNGKSEYINLDEQIEKNSDGGMYILLQLVPDFKVGQKFKKGDILAHDKLSFMRMGAKNNLAYNVGALVKVAFPNSDDGYEDSTVCSQWMSEALASEILIKKEITLSPNTNVYDLVKPGQEIQEGDPLILFQNSFSEKDANLLLKNITDDELVSDLGRIRIRSHYTGWIQDVEVLRTRPTETYSESIQKIIKDYDKRKKPTRDVYKKYGIGGMNKLDPDGPLPETGELKNVGDGIKINIYIKYVDKFSVGDKNVAQSAAKGVNKAIFPKGKEPYSSYRPEEKIHAIYAVGSFNARMITSVINSGAINKGLIELDRQVKEIMGIPWKSLEDIQFSNNSDKDLSI